MKMSVLYFSKSGNTKKMAERIAQGMISVPGVEAGIFPIEAVDEAFVRDSKCVVVGTPTYLASMANQIKVWLDTVAIKLGLAGKIGGAFATEDYLHGGGDLAIQSLVSHLMVLGMLAYSGGGAHGKPVIHLGPVGLRERLDECAPTFEVYGQRMAGRTMEIFGRE